MKLTITIDLNHEAFDEHPDSETAQILEGLVRKIRAGISPVVGCGIPIYGTNGNEVGEFLISETMELDTCRVCCVSTGLACSECWTEGGLCANCTCPNCPKDKENPE